MMNRESQEDRCKLCHSVYRCIAYTMASGDIMAVKECDCAFPPTNDVSAHEPLAKEALP